MFAQLTAPTTSSMPEATDSLKRIQKELPEAVFRKLETMEPLTQDAFTAEFNKKKKSPFMASVLGFFLGLHYAYVGRVWMTIVFWLTLGGLMIWWFVDLFRVTGLVREYNKSLALRVLADIRVLH